MDFGDCFSCCGIVVALISVVREEIRKPMWKKIGYLL